MKLKSNTGFSIKFGIIIILIGFLIFDFFLQYYYPSEYLKGVPTESRLNVYYAYFTTQSNYLTVCYLLFSLIYTRIYKSRTPFAVDLAVTTYISLTMLIFWTTLISTANMSDGSFNNFATIDWITTVVLHLIIPCIMIYTFFSSCGNKYYSLIKHNKLTLFTISSYPAFYLIYQLVRGYIRYKQFGPDFIENNFWYIKDQTGNYIMQSSWYHYTDENGNNIYSAGQTMSADLYGFTMWVSYFFLNTYKFTYSLKLKEYVEISPGNKQYVWTNEYCNGSTTSLSPFNIEFNTTSHSKMVFFFLLCCSVIAFLTFALQFYFIHVNNKTYFKTHKPNKENWSNEELQIIKWKKSRILYFTNGIYFSKFVLLRNLVLWCKLKKDYKNLDKQEVKKIYSERKQYIKSIIVENREVMSDFNKEIRKEKKYVKSIISEIPYIDRHVFKDNINEARIFRWMRIKGILITLTQNDINKYNDDQALKNKT